MRHPDRESLTLVALGEQPVVDELSAHLDRCGSCRAEVTAMRDTVALAREAGPVPLETPPEHVWAGIAAELALDTAEPAGAPGPPRSRRAVIAMAVAVAAALIAAVIAIASVPNGDTNGPREIAFASLSAYAAGPPDGTGRASVVDIDGQRRLEVAASMPPAPDRGYYEVWLLDERTNSMIAIGTLGDAGSGTFTMPANVDMTRYSVVDVSAERYDGDPAHAASVLRGRLTS